MNIKTSLHNTYNFFLENKKKYCIERECPTLWDNAAPQCWVILTCTQQDKYNYTEHRYESKSA